jgi:hypothetical protein
MNMKPPHPVLLLFGIGVGVFAVYFHLFPKTDDQVDGGGRFAIGAFMLLILLLIAALCKWIAGHLFIECDEDEPPSTD